MYYLGILIIFLCVLTINDLRLNLCWASLARCCKLATIWVYCFIYFVCTVVAEISIWEPLNIFICIYFNLFIAVLSIFLYIGSRLICFCPFSSLFWAASAVWAGTSSWPPCLLAQSWSQETNQSALSQHNSSSSFSSKDRPHRWAYISSFVWSLKWESIVKKGNNA